MLAERYLLGGILGEGGFGSVYAATDRRTGASVAVKLLPALDAARVRREIDALRVLRLPGVVGFLDAGTHQGRACLVMERVDGHRFPGPLARRDWASLAPRAEALLDVLAGVHDAGVVHRDLKPANVLVGDDGRLTLVDFGLARGAPLGPTITAGGVRLGTPRYLAPEQLLGQRVDARADLYAVGVMLTEVLLGEPPFPDDDWGRSAMLRQAPPPLARRVPELPYAALRLLERLLSPDPADRPPNAREARALLHTRHLLPRLGPAGVFDALLAAARKGESLDLWGPPGSGRSRILDELAATLVAEGRPVMRARRGERPVESLRHELEAEVTGSLGLGPFERALRARLEAGAVLLLDRSDGVDAWSQSLAAHCRDAGAVIRVVDTPEALRLRALTPAELAAFAGPAAAELHARTQGLPARVADEVGRWVAQGAARVDAAGLTLLGPMPPALGVEGDLPA